ncbi:MAG TPA: acetyl-CoA carboxylase, carboxyltransferase subunit beta [Alphaproteobacteria bacterium]|nr:acetyl-CoA carboxylase, carboxyltransferase subunit beta [Alphaproteobacteria bacterium]
MNWLTDVVRPRISTRTKKGVAAAVWEKCPGCAELIYDSDLPKTQYVCPHCGYHLKMGLTERLENLLDPGFKTLEQPVLADDPLKFRDKKKYADRLKDARKTTGQPEGGRVVKGAIEGHKLVVGAMDFDFMAGSMGRAVGQAIVLAAQQALKDKLPLLVISASGGARMQEGALSLMQMVRTTAAIVELKAAGLPYLVLLTNPTTGGVTASFAMEGDVMLAEPGALIGFAGPRVIQQTIGQQLPEGFQTAEYLLEHGMIDAVTPRAAQRETIAKIVKTLTGAR